MGAAQVRLGAHAAEQRDDEVRLEDEGDRSREPRRPHRGRRQPLSAADAGAGRLRAGAAQRRRRRAQQSELQRRGPGQPVAIARAQHRAADSARQTGVQRRRHHRGQHSRAVRRRRVDHDRTRESLSVSVVQNEHDELGAKGGAAAGLRGERLRQRAVPSRSLVRRAVHEPALVRRRAVRAEPVGADAADHPGRAAPGQARCDTHDAAHGGRAVTGRGAGGRRRHLAGGPLQESRSARLLLPEADARGRDQADPRPDPAGVQALPGAGGAGRRRGRRLRAASQPVQQETQTAGRILVWRRRRRTRWPRAALQRARLFQRPASHRRDRRQPAQDGRCRSRDGSEGRFHPDAQRAGDGGTRRRVPRQRRRLQQQRRRNRADPARRGTEPRPLAAEPGKRGAADCGEKGKRRRVPDQGERRAGRRDAQVHGAPRGDRGPPRRERERAPGGRLPHPADARTG